MTEEHREVPTPLVRPRRLRRTPALRRMVAETAVRPSSLVLPVFVREKATEPRPIASMPGVVQHSRDSLKAAVAEVGDALPVMADLCLDEFTDHGHCGVLTPSGEVDNDATLELYAEMALAQAQAGVHVVGPSGMMDGQVRVIRSALDSAGRQDVAILAYSAKYASAFYGPFREAVASSLQGDRRTYQQDGRNVRESVREVLLDVAEGADLVMVKPALAYLDVIRAVREAVDLPVAAYNISGEYSMVEAAAANGWIDREPAILETLTSIRRAGADVVLTYWAAEAARLLRR